MMGRSMPPLRRGLQALLDLEREIPPVQEAVRRRADLRARTALWYVRHGAEPSSRSLPRFSWLRVALAGVTVASASLGAWLVVDAPPKFTEPAANVSSPPPSNPAPSTAAVAPTPKPETEEPETAPPSNQEPAKSVAPSQVSHPARERSKPTGQPSSADVELLDEARRALGAREFQRALRTLSQHQRRFPKSQLAEERDALRVRALDGAGRKDAAKRAISGFEERHPDSVLAPSLSNPPQEKR